MDRLLTPVGITVSLVSSVLFLGLLKALGIDLTGWVDQAIDFVADGWRWLGRKALAVIAAVGQG